MLHKTLSAQMLSMLINDLKVTETPLTWSVNQERSTKEGGKYEHPRKGNETKLYPFLPMK